MPIESARKLEAFVKSGGIVVATGKWPSVVPGVQATEKVQTELKEIVTRLQSSRLVKLVSNDAELGPVLNSLLHPDARIAPSAKDFGVVHRKTADADIYFIANTSNQTRKVEIEFRTRGEPEVWDAITGRFLTAKRVVKSCTECFTETLALTFEPYRSYVVVFSKKASVPNTGPISEIASSIDLNSDWSVSYGSQPAVRLAKLRLVGGQRSHTIFLRHGHVRTDHRCLERVSQVGKGDRA